MRQILTIAQVVISVLLVVVILLQEKGVGLGSSFGGGGEFYRSKRGIDKFLFAATVVLSVLFIGSAMAHLFVK